MKSFYCFFVLLLCATAWCQTTAAGITNDWKASAPAEQGMDAATLSKMEAHVRAELPHVRSILIARHGRLVFEEYYNGGNASELQNIQSMTKSVTSALVGVAIM